LHRFGIALALLAMPQVVGAAPARAVPEKTTGKQRRAERRARDHSEGGTRRGIVEFSLGAVAAGVTILLVGRGGWEIRQGQKLIERCEDDTALVMEAECFQEDPAQGNKIAAGLSFGFTVPVAIASAFLFTLGARALRDYKAWHRKDAKLGLAPWVAKRGAGMGLHLEF
jgi:hypothetical protein